MQPRALQLPPQLGSSVQLSVYTNINKHVRHMQKHSSIAADEKPQSALCRCLTDVNGFGYVFVTPHHCRRPLRRYA